MFKHKFLSKGFIFILFLILSLLLVIGYTQKLKRQKDQPKYSDKLAQYVCSVVSGEIKPTDPISVRFVSTMISKTEVGNQVKENVFHFTPKIKGKTLWKDRRTLEFHPDSPLPMRQKCIGRLDLNKLISDTLTIEPLEFTFSVIGREVIAFKGDFVLISRNEKYDKMIYTGEIEFSLPAKFEDVKRFVIFQMDDKSFPLEWIGKGEDSKFTFQSQIIKRDKFHKQFKFRINKRHLELSEDFMREFSLESLYEMKVVQIYRIDENNRPALEIEFSDVLDPTQDINGLILVEPLVKLQLQKLGKKVIVYGDFQFGEKYHVKVNANIKNKFGNKADKDYSKEFVFNDQKPQIAFSSDGMFLPSVQDRKIYFQTLNLKKVHLEIIKVFESNLGQFLQMQKLNSNRTRNAFFHQMDRVGITIVNEKLEISEIRNQWLQHELNICNLIPNDEKGLLLIKLYFKKDDILYRSTVSSKKNLHYYSDPNRDGYYYRHAQIYKPIILSDIGLTHKQTKNKHIIYATNLLTTNPIKDATIKLRTYQNQVIKELETDREGKAVFEKSKQDVFYVEAEYYGQRSILKLNEMGWNLSTFDVDGVESITDGIRAFIYTERGVYRPGDKINVSMIFRNKDNTFPENHPVETSIFNPRNQKIFESILKTGRDGFYHFAYQTKPEDMTGNWKLKVKAGSQTFYHTLKIETVVPERLKIKLEPAKEEVLAKDKKLQIDLDVTYLFGNPASGLHTTLKAELFSIEKKFSKYKSYFFSNETIDFKKMEFTVFDDKLNENGKAEIEWNLPPLLNAPSTITAKLQAEVIEKGGRTSKKKIYIQVEPYEYYVGIEKNPNKRIKLGSPYSFNIVLVNKDGNPKAGEELKVRIYRNNQYWWWEYDDRNKARVHFKTDSETELLSEEIIYSTTAPYSYEFIPERWGEYLIEVQHQNEEIGHTATIFLRASYWGLDQTEMENAGILTLKTDKPVYHSGEEAVITFPVPTKSRILVTVEKANEILDHYWYNPVKKKKEAEIKIPITNKMIPNAYCTISVIQPYAQTENDRPIRMYGVIPIKVEDPATHQELFIDMPDELRPNKTFTCKIQTADKKQTQFTIAVVDEGLLSLTDFQTPDAWNEFYKKLRLGVITYDNFNQIIGVTKGDIFKTFSVGGDVDYYRKGQLKPERAKRFKPVCMFKGPIETDYNGFAQMQFEMPEYIGEVRVMVVSANQNRYGKAEKSVPVKNEIMLLPTLPRVLAPLDMITIPVEVFTMKDDIKNVNVKLKIEGPIQIIGNSENLLSFEKSGDKITYFKIKVNPEVGIANIVLTAESEKYQSSYHTEIAIRPNSPRISKSEEKKCAPGDNVSFLIPNDGIKGTNRVSITIARKPKLNIEHRINWLIRYPYWCVEQTVSAVFPQLYLKSFIKKSLDDEEEIDRNINGAIKRLRKFQLPNGSFSYWPGRTEASKWGTNYAGHFLLEAKKLGYFVPQEMITNWIRYQKSVAIKNENLHDDLWMKIQLYRLYLLALAADSELAPMNLLKESRLVDMNDTERWMLAAAYQLSGVNTTAEQIAMRTGLIVKDYTELCRTYGSGLRDKAIILECLLVMNRDEESEKLYINISEQLSSKDWYSTQTTGYALLSLGKYIYANPEDFNDNSPLIGIITLPDGKEIPFNSQEFSVKKEIPDSFGDNIVVEIDNKTKLSNAFIMMNWDGIPLKPYIQDESNGLLLHVDWLDDEEHEIDPTTIQQGKTFKAHIQVEKTINQSLENIALVQILPSGWEIENKSISSDEDLIRSSKNTKKHQYGKIDYVDIRDDRIIWFFNMNRYRKKWKHNAIMDFEVELRAVTVGEFELPPTLCEVMYDNKYKAIRTGHKVKVERW